MIQLHFHTQEDSHKQLSARDGETKLGQSIQYISSLDDLKNHTSRYVVFGICEDMGVQANFGKTGTAKAWSAFLRSFLNIQDNKYNHGSSIILLGHISVKPDFTITAETPKEELGAVVSRIDKMVTQVVKAIVAAGKIPIAIGGGHNNAFGMIKGTATALNTAINVINIDAHTDLRTADYRHSGNGFRYAYENEPRLLNKYCIFGLHKNYTPAYIFEWIEARKEEVKYVLFEDIIAENNGRELYKDMIAELSVTSFGLELDCDAIENFSSSAITPSGFNLSDIRNLISITGLSKKCSYFHLCEAAPTNKNMTQIGKALSYMVTDFIHSKNED
ncbi:formimidoylglutamase [Dokdonia sinensis]|uniref:Formimidoylglutamase n=1 Tax=Dokdonia sinensis TaxID=2479847 RepID=A0A3M0GEC5_9FLAO|nr:formimidoylglutamase [Dokdonia sinensis]RMB59509.1 formimidoylglutamase [Dokdonia sinensis]